MTIKINVGVNKKIGLPDYGSAGSHCNIEIEADNSVLNDVEQFLQRVKGAYEVARHSVESELAHHRTHQSRQSSVESAQKQEYRNDNSYSTNNSSTGNYIASAKQQQFIASLVKVIKGLDWRTLDKYCNAKFGKSISQISPKQASELIDDLKAAKDGRKEIAA
jgi:hypothetical protein